MHCITACLRDLMHAWLFTCVLMWGRPRVVWVGSGPPKQGVDLQDGCEGAQSSGEELQLEQPAGAPH